MVRDRIGMGIRGGETEVRFLVAYCILDGMFGNEGQRWCARKWRSIGRVNGEESKNE